MPPRMTRNTLWAEPTISVRAVWKRYSPASRAAGASGVDALRGASLEITDPGFYGVMGRSGSGKSTLLHLLAGLDRPDGGELLVCREPIHEMTDAELVLYRRRTVGIIFQQFNLLPTLDALANTILPGVLDGQPRQQLEARGHALLDELGLSNRAHHRPEALSGGEQQRVAIARALLLSPTVILADEPTGNLDSTSAGALWKLLEETAARHRVIVLMVTHEATAAAHCRRTFVLEDGRVAGDFESHGLNPTELAHRASEFARTT
ncbi:MAG: ABC transporter ATP-binding protein [Phycisphaerales bacterium]|nr:ABC transporter ATP-binding protein [Phycisphaerales bacterium]